MILSFFSSSSWSNISIGVDILFASANFALWCEGSDSGSDAMSFMSAMGQFKFAAIYCFINESSFSNIARNISGEALGFLATLDETLRRSFANRSRISLSEFTFDATDSRMNRVSLFDRVRNMDNGVIFYLATAFTTSSFSLSARIEIIFASIFGFCKTDICRA